MDPNEIDFEYHSVLDTLHQIIDKHTSSNQMLRRFYSWEICDRKDDLSPGDSLKVKSMVYPVEPETKWDVEYFPCGKPEEGENGYSPPPYLQLSLGSLPRNGGEDFVYEKDISLYVTNTSLHHKYRRRVNVHCTFMILVDGTEILRREIADIFEVGKSVGYRNLGIYRSGLPLFFTLNVLVQWWPVPRIYFLRERRYRRSSDALTTVRWRLPVKLVCGKFNQISCSPVFGREGTLWKIVTNPIRVQLMRPFRFGASIIANVSVTFNGRSYGQCDMQVYDMSNTRLSRIFHLPDSLKDEQYVTLKVRILYTLGEISVGPDLDRTARMYKIHAGPLNLLSVVNSGFTAHGDKSKRRKFTFNTRALPADSKEMQSEDVFVEEEANTKWSFELIPCKENGVKGVGAVLRNLSMDGGYHGKIHVHCIYKIMEGKKEILRREMSYIYDKCDSFYGPLKLTSKQIQQNNFKVVAYLQWSAAPCYRLPKNQVDVIWRVEGSPHAEESILCSPVFGRDNCMWNIELHDLSTKSSRIKLANVRLVRLPPKNKGVAARVAIWVPPHEPSSHQKRFEFATVSEQIRIPNEFATTRTVRVMIDWEYID